MKGGRSMRGCALGLLIAAGIATLAGCGGYSNYPRIQGDTAFNNPNSPDMLGAMQAAIAWVHERYPVEGPFALNLPEGMSRRRVYLLLDELNIPNARALTPETADLPTYHVARVFVRATNAEVDIVRPVTTVRVSQHEGTVSQTAAHQLITVRVKDTFQGWRALGERAYIIGAAEPPAPRFIPESDTPAGAPGPRSWEIEDRVRAKQERPQEPPVDDPALAPPRRQAP
jgi:hypothetical protein